MKRELREIANELDTIADEVKDYESEIEELEDKIEALEDKIEALEDEIEELKENAITGDDGKDVTVKVITETDYIGSCWLSEEIERIIGIHGIKKAYEIFKQID